MTALKNICVFCASSTDVDDVYKDAAARIGALIASEELGLVYGGARVGLMGILADAALGQQGRVIGVIPILLKDKELMHERLSELHVTDTMQQRQKLMSDLADAFVVLPGGLGTLAEFFEAVTWKQLGLHEKPIMIVNLNGYWDDLLNMIDHSIQHGFMRRSHGATLFEVITDIEGFQTALKALRTP